MGQMRSLATITHDRPPKLQTASIVPGQSPLTTDHSPLTVFFAWCSQQQRASDMPELNAFPPPRYDP
jgi:hypothetical protein